MYLIKFTPRAEKYLKKLKDENLKRRMKDAMLLLADNPYQGKRKKGDLAGIYGYDVYYNKTNYEIAYRIYEVKEKTVVVIMAGTRENFYEELKKYLE